MKAYYNACSWIFLTHLFDFVLALIHMILTVTNTACATNTSCNFSTKSGASFHTQFHAICLIESPLGCDFNAAAHALNWRQICHFYIKLVLVISRIHIYSPLCTFNDKWIRTCFYCTFANWLTQLAKLFIVLFVVIYNLKVNNFGGCVYKLWEVYPHKITKKQLLKPAFSIDPILFRLK